MQHEYGVPYVVSFLATIIKLILTETGAVTDQNIFKGRGVLVLSKSLHGVFSGLSLTLIDSYDFKLSQKG